MKLSIDKVLDEPDLIIWRHRGTSKRLVVCFSSVGADTDERINYELPSVASCKGRDEVLFVADQRRTWFNGDGLMEKVVAHVEKVAQEIGAEEICTIGHSMGGFCASILPAFTRVDVALAFAPQASVHPEIAGDDRRWLSHRNRISSFRYRELADHMSSKTTYFAIYGSVLREKPQRDRYPTGKNVELMSVDEIGHNVSQRLKRFGLIQNVVQSAFRNNVPDFREALESRLKVAVLSGHDVEHPRAPLPPFARRHKVTEALETVS